MDCIVLDDESVSREIINFLCDQEPNTNLVGSFSSAMEAFKFLNLREVDLIFLDIHMPGFTGFEFIQTLKSPPLIIITSSDTEQASEAFSYDSIIDFLKKPIDPDRFKKAIDKALKIKKKDLGSMSKEPSLSSQEHVYINIDKKLIKLDIAEINLLIADGDYVKILTTGNEYRVHTTLSNMQQKLPADTFMKIHRSYLINLHKIVDIQDNTILIDKTVVPISRTRRAEFIRRLNLI
ncbi:LytR/AlgR family response regulator transcription factor [Algoriphagus mannitolivorans]|uniref:LytR/AlgR family response regulator transcription factor n=1 Tax=Algoriphagus mannitolivorans TaxID=226504 RepID=UPI000412138C|nr:LytTR family DNA-binding domain-containing protein [Algoriphagus mannitolivorans]